MLFPELPTGAAVLTVSQVTGEIKNLLEGGLGLLWVVGEVTSRTLARSGHLYIDMKDAGAVLKAVMWRTSVQRLVDLPEVGTEIIVRGRVSVYPPQGNYQLVIDEIHTKGEGAQDVALRKLKQRLHKAGYFAAERKRSLPRFPRRIAVVASPTGAAVRDILETLRKRWSIAEVWLLAVRVQGPDAPESIERAFALLNRFGGVDVVILARGGGSSDDLSAFNDERVAHALFRCKFPVVSAIGHEIDVTIADQVADLRALTPTDAANRICPDCGEMIDELRNRFRRIRDLTRGRVQLGRARLDELARRRAFASPIERLRDRERGLDDWSERLHRAIQKRVQLAQKGVEAMAAHLESLSPLNVLARGYSLTRTLPARHVVRDVAQVEIGDRMEIVVRNGRLTARVENKEV